MQYNSGTDKYFAYHYDNIGSTTLITARDGHAVERFSYGTYGELLRDPITKIRFLYNGSYGVATDSNGLYYMRARYYNPYIKRFINQDIKVGDIGSSQSLNRYAYCEGNPVSMVDPFGLCPNDPDGINWTSFWAHLLLGAGGMIPDIGFVFDLADAALCHYEHDDLGMAISLTCAIPGTGEAIGLTKAGRQLKHLGGYIADAIRTSRKITKTADKAVDVAKTSRTLLRSGLSKTDGIIAILGGKGSKFFRNCGENLEYINGISQEMISSCKGEIRAYLAESDGDIV